MVIACVALPMGCGIISSPGKGRRTSWGVARHKSNIFNILILFLPFVRTRPAYQCWRALLTLRRLLPRRDCTHQHELWYDGARRSVRVPSLVVFLTTWCRPFQYEV